MKIPEKLPEELKLPQEFKTKWLNALRSGNYKQGRNMLVQTSKDLGSLYCCLGVAGAICDIDDDRMEGLAAFNGPNECLFKDTSLPNFFIRPSAAQTTVLNYLMGMNDGNDYDDRSPLSFDEISTWIEANL